jgi:hypothetical protein
MGGALLCCDSTKKDENDKQNKPMDKSASEKKLKDEEIIKEMALIDNSQLFSEKEESSPEKDDQGEN